MFSNKFSKILSVGSSVVISASSVANTSVSAEKFKWWSLFLYFFGVNMLGKERGNTAKEGNVSSCDQAQDYNDNSLENSEDEDVALFKSIFQEAKEKKAEAEDVFQSINEKLKELYRQKEELEIEVEKEKNSGISFGGCLSRKSALIIVCEEIGEIKAKIGFLRSCVKCEKVRFVKKFCEETEKYICKRQMNAGQDIYDNGVVVYPESEGYTKGFKNTDLLINITWQLKTCRLRLKFSEDETDEKRIIDIKNKEDLISNSVPFSEVASSAIYYLKNQSQQDTRL